MKTIKVLALDRALMTVNPTKFGGLPGGWYRALLIGSLAILIGLLSSSALSAQPIAQVYQTKNMDSPFMAGDVELTGTEWDYDEFSGAATAPSPVYVVGQSGLDRIRPYIGYSYGDPSGGNKAQFLQFNNLTVGKRHTFFVLPSTFVGDRNAYNAAAQGAWIVEGITIDGNLGIWKIVFDATSTSALIRLGNYYDASNSGGQSHFMYIDAIFSMIGELEQSSSMKDFDEFIGATRAYSPTYVFGQSDPSYVRHYIGYSYGDPEGGNKAQYLQLTNLTVGRNYILDIYVSANYGDGNCYFATVISGGTVVDGICKGWNRTGYLISSLSPLNPIEALNWLATVRWRIVVNAQSSSLTLRIGNYWNAQNSGGVSRFIYLDAIAFQPN